MSINLFLFKEQTTMIINKDCSHFKSIQCTKIAGTIYPSHTWNINKDFKQPLTFKWKEKKEKSGMSFRWHPDILHYSYRKFHKQTFSDNLFSTLRNSMNYLFLHFSPIIFVVISHILPKFDCIHFLLLCSMCWTWRHDNVIWNYPIRIPRALHS